MTGIAMDWESKLKPEDKIPHCTEGKTLKESQEQCPFGGCWVYRCRSSTYNAAWHEGFVKAKGVEPITDAELEAGKK